MALNLDKWLRAAPPADDLEIARLVKASSFVLPSEFLSLLRIANGGEGPLAISPWWFQLWSTTEIPQHNAGYETEKWFPEFVGFGSSGGGEMFAFRQGAGSKVFAIPSCDSDPNDITVVADSFNEFVASMGQEPNKAIQRTRSKQRASER